MFENNNEFAFVSRRQSHWEKMGRDFRHLILMIGGSWRTLHWAHHGPSDQLLHLQLVEFCDPVLAQVRSGHDFSSYSDIVEANLISLIIFLKSLSQIGMSPRYLVPRRTTQGTGSTDIGPYAGTYGLWAYNNTLKVRKSICWARVISTVSPDW